MATHSVRLNKETEQTLEQLRRETGKSTSELLRMGIEKLKDDVAEEETKTPFEIYEEVCAEFNLDEGDRAKASAENAESAVKDVIRDKWNK